MKLAFDPGDENRFWEAVESIPGYPRAEGRPIQAMLFEPDALEQLSGVLEAIGVPRPGPLLAVMDPTPMRRGRDSLKPLLLDRLAHTGWQVKKLVLEPDRTGQVHSDMFQIERVQRELRSGAALLAIGSGTITDIAKHAAFLAGQETGSRIRFAVLPTANSVSAYTSNMAPTFVHTLKRTLPSRYPDAVICDLKTLRDAPHEMTVAGAGDLLAMFVSVPDWYLACRLGLDSGYSELPRLLLGSLDTILLEQAEGIGSPTLEAMAILAKLVILGGLAMSLSHATTPMSGFEHEMSHLLDLQAKVAGRPLAVHGTQVGLTAVIGAASYGHFLGELEPAEVEVERCYPAPPQVQAKILEGFAKLDPTGKVGGEFWSGYRVKLEAWHAHRAEFVSVLKEWPQMRREIQSRTCRPELLVRILRAIGAPLDFRQLTPPVDEPEVRFAFENAPFMRRRMTIADLLVFLSWDRERLWHEVWRESRELGEGATR
ncbi:MAG: iron-containing alcohol dehydrogenase [Anaerolineales bacterium]|jgi:glycerol-1-phosphate dehydrogenase [NAD(P)+]